MRVVIIPNAQHCCSTYEQIHSHQRVVCVGMDDYSMSVDRGHHGGLVTKDDIDTDE